MCECSAQTNNHSCTWLEQIIYQNVPWLLPRARMREAGLSNRFCPSVSQSVSRLSVRRKKLKSPHIGPHKPSKWSQTIANSKKLLYVYLTEVKALRFAVFRLFPTFHNYHNIGSTRLRDLRVPSRT